MWDKAATEIMLRLSQCIVSICDVLLPVVLTLITWSARFLHCEVTVETFIINKCLEEDTIIEIMQIPYFSNFDLRV